jgi:hypothetical protein
MGNAFSAVLGTILVYYIKISEKIKNKISGADQESSNSPREGLLSGSNQEHNINIENQNSQNFHRISINNTSQTGLNIQTNITNSHNNKVVIKTKNKNDYDLLKTDDIDKEETKELEDISREIKDIKLDIEDGEELKNKSEFDNIDELMDQLRG